MKLYLLKKIKILYHQIKIKKESEIEQLSNTLFKQFSTFSQDTVKEESLTTYENIDFWSIHLPFTDLNRKLKKTNEDHNLKFQKENKLEIEELFKKTTSKKNNTNDASENKADEDDDDFYRLFYFTNNIF